MVVGNSWGDLLGTVLPPQVGTRMANRLFGLERNSPAQSIANKVFIFNGGTSRNTLGCQLSDGGSGDFKRDLRCRNPIYWARLRGGVLQYRLKYRNADLGTSSKAPRFCLKHTLHQYRTCPHGAMGLSRPGLSGFYTNGISA